MRLPVLTLECVSNYELVLIPGAWALQQPEVVELMERLQCTHKADDVNGFCCNRRYSSVIYVDNSRADWPAVLAHEIYHALPNVRRSIAEQVRADEFEAHLVSFFYRRCFQLLSLGDCLYDFVDMVSSDCDGWGALRLICPKDIRLSDMSSGDEDSSSTAMQETLGDLLRLDAPSTGCKLSSIGVLWIIGPAGCGKSTFIRRFTDIGLDVDRISTRLHSEWHCVPALMLAAIEQGKRVIAGICDNVDEVVRCLIRRGIHITLCYMISPLNRKAIEARNARHSDKKWDINVEEMARRRKAIVQRIAHEYKLPLYYLTFEGSKLENGTGSSPWKDSMGLRFPMHPAFYFGWDGKDHPEEDRLVQGFFEWCAKHADTIAKYARWKRYNWHTVGERWADLTQLILDASKLDHRRMH
jgi:hypothetical protein